MNESARQIWETFVHQQFYWYSALLIMYTMKNLFFSLYAICKYSVGFLEILGRDFFYEIRELFI